MFKLTVEGETLDELKANLALAAGGVGGKPAATGSPRSGKPKDDVPPPEEEDDGSEGITYEDVSALVVRVSKEVGRDDAINLLKRFKGANGKATAKAAEILPKDYPEAKAEAEKLLEAGDVA